MAIQQRGLSARYLICVACFFGALAASDVIAITVNWDGQEDDNWHAGINWDKTVCGGFFCGLFSPGPDDDAVLSNTSFGFLSEFSADTVVRSVKIQNGITVDTNGFQLNSGARNTASSSRIQIIGGASRLKVEGGGGIDPDLITNRFEIFGNGSLLQLDDALVTITSASGASTVNPASTIRGSGAITFNNTSGSPQVVFENAGMIDVFGGDLTLRAENGGMLDLDGALGDDGILDVDDGNFFGISGSRTLRVEGPLLTAFDGTIRIGRGDTVDFELPWQLGQFDQPMIPGSARLRMRGGVGTATLSGAPVTVIGADTNIDVESGIARFEAEMNIQQVTLTMTEGTTLQVVGEMNFNGGVLNIADNSTLQVVGEMNFTGGVLNIADDSTVEFLGNVDIAENVVINSGSLIAYDLLIAGNTTIRSTFFDWDSRPQAHTTTIQGGALRILSEQIDLLGGLIDDIPGINDFGGVVHLNSEPGKPAVLEVSTIEPWVLSREMSLNGIADVARVEGVPFFVGNADMNGAEAVIHVVGENAEIASVTVLRQNSEIATDPMATLRFTNELSIESGAELTGGGKIRSEHIATIRHDIQMQVTFVNDGTFNLRGFSSDSKTGQLSLDGFEQTTDGIFNVDLGGTMPAEFDRLIVGDSPMLAGTLNVSLVDGFTLTAGDVFVIIDGAAPVVGTFDGLAEGDPVGNFAGVDLLITYLADEGKDVALVVPGGPGDFDFDIDVDGFDFLKWQRGESPNPLSQSDLNDWLTNYGTVVPLSATSTAVPEPSTRFLLVLAMGIILTGHRKAVSKLNSA